MPPKVTIRKVFFLILKAWPTSVILHSTSKPRPGGEAGLKCGIVRFSCLAGGTRSWCSVMNPRCRWHADERRDNPREVLGRRTALVAEFLNYSSTGS